MEHPPSQPDSEDGRRKSRAASIVLWSLLAIAAFYLIAEHRAHVLGWLPWLLVLACPLLHIFLHGGHGRHVDGQQPANRRRGHSH